MARQETAGTLINRAAVEMGLPQATDPFSSQDDSFRQLVGLLNSAGQELLTLVEWNELTRQFTFNTDDADVNGYVPLPDDYDHLIMQTSWDTTEEVPAYGPLTEQQWNYLLGRNLISDTIYVNWRINLGRIELFPVPPPENRNIIIQYVSRGWVRTGTDPDVFSDTAVANGNLVLLDPFLVVKFLKLKFLQMKQMPSAHAAMEFDTMLQQRMGQDKGARIVSAGGGPRGFPYLDAIYNTPDTGFGRT